MEERFWIEAEVESKLESEVDRVIGSIELWFGHWLMRIGQWVRLCILVKIF